MKMDILKTNCEKAIKLWKKKKRKSNSFIQTEYRNN